MAGTGSNQNIEFKPKKELSLSPWLELNKDLRHQEFMITSKKKKKFHKDPTTELYNLCFSNCMNSIDHLCLTKSSIILKL